jgi:hypothetical protein
MASGEQGPPIDRMEGMQAAVVDEHLEIYGAVIVLLVTALTIPHS